MLPRPLSSRRYWSAQELVVLGVFSAAAKVSTLLVALAGGDEPREPARQEPHLHHAARGHALQGAQSRARWPSSCS
ncbi:MAG: hypothetical protein V8Q84_09270 [Bilophila sp.]